MALMMLLRMEQRAYAGNVYCTCNGNCDKGISVSSAVSTYGFSFPSNNVTYASSGSLAVRCQYEVCKTAAAAVCISSDLVSSIKSGGAGKEIRIMKGCESTITASGGYSCGVVLAASGQPVSCPSGYYFVSGSGSGDCELCPAHYGVQPDSPGTQAPIIACRFDSTTKFTDAKGTFHFTNGCNYTS